MDSPHFIMKVEVQVDPQAISPKIIAMMEHRFYLLLCGDRAISGAAIFVQLTTRAPQKSHV